MTDVMRLGRPGLFGLLTCVLLFAAACGGPRYINDVFEPAPTQPSVTVEKNADGTWSATWQFAEPTRVLRFERPGSFRSRIFEIVTPGFQMERDGEGYKAWAARSISSKSGTSAVS